MCGLATGVVITARKPQTQTKAGFEILFHRHQVVGRINPVKAGKTALRLLLQFHRRQINGLPPAQHTAGRKIGAVKIVIMAADEHLPFVITAKEIIIGCHLQGPFQPDVLRQGQRSIVQTFRLALQIEIERRNTFSGVAQHGENKPRGRQMAKRAPVKMPGIQRISGWILLCRIKRLGVHPDRRYPARADDTGQHVMHRLTGRFRNVQEHNRFFRQVHGPSFRRSMMLGLNGSVSAI